MTTLAHGGGIPETLMVVIPMALVVVFLRLGAKATPPEEPGEGTDDDQQAS